MAKSSEMNEVITAEAMVLSESGKGIRREVAANDGMAPEWIELIPAGEFSGRDGRGPYCLKDPAAVIAATNAQRMDAGIPVDYDHATDFGAPEGRPAPAAGWIKELEVRGGEVWGRVDWTPHGAAAVAMREYRYVSPVFEYGENREVFRLLRAALTNNPNLYLTAISARSLKSGASAVRAQRMDANAAGPADEEIPMEEFLAQMRELFGLEADATPEEIMAAAREMAGGGAREQVSDASEAAPTGVSIAAYHENVDPSRYVSVAHFQQAVSELNAMRATRAREHAEHAVGAAMRAGKLVPAQRDWAIAYCQVDVKGFENFVARQPAVALGELGFTGEPPHPMSRPERDGANGMLTTVSGRLTPAELAVCSRLAIKPNDYLKRKAACGDYVELNRT